MSVRVAAVQAAPVFMDLGKTLEKTYSLIEKAALNEAQLIVFPETWLPGYPAWLDCCRDVGFWDHEPVKRVYAKLVDNSVVVPSTVTEQLGNAALKHALCSTSASMNEF